MLADYFLAQLPPDRIALWDLSLPHDSEAARQFGVRHCRLRPAGNRGTTACQAPSASTITAPHWICWKR
jgi:hypothetical protein